jgi:outer membrane protein OmpA-like peptidoglycan-associated protein
MLAVAYFSLGDLYFRTREYAKAVETYDQGLRLEPTDRLANKRRELALRLKNQNVPDAETIQEVLGGEEWTIMSPVGVKPDRRFPISVPFAYNEDKFLPEAKIPLHELGTALKTILQSTTAVFLIEGHTDSRGTEPYNLDLSERRASRVAEYLVQVFQIPTDRLKIKGFGKARLLNLGASEADHARNRRVEVVRLDAARQDSPSSDLPFVLEVAVFYEDPESRPQKLAEGAVLRSGDGYRIYFEPYQPCYVYIFQRDSTGKLTRLYPNADFGTRDNFVQARVKYWVPERDKWFELDTTRGTEEIYVVATTKRREDLEDLFTRLTRQASADQPEAQRQDQRELTAVLQKMGVAQIRPGKPVEVAPTPGSAAVLTTDQLRREGLSFAHKFTFRHE